MGAFFLWALQVRYAAIVEYNGWAFHGWQHQPDAHSVQDAVEDALSRVADEPIAVVCAGRTDSGVHAVGQVVHFDTGAIRPEKAWTMGSNTVLSADVAIRQVIPVSEEFHARYSATSRRYRYVIANVAQRPALLHRRAYWVHQRLDLEAMSRAAESLLGEHDFSAFRTAACQAKSPVRTIHSVEISADRHCVYIDIVANAFLHNMVRIITGTLIAVGKGEQPSAWLAELLAGHRSRPLVFATLGHEDGIFACGSTARDTGGLLVSYLARSLQVAPLEESDPDEPEDAGEP